MHPGQLPGADSLYPLLLLKVHATIIYRASIEGFKVLSIVAVSVAWASHLHIRGHFAFSQEML